jgi:LysM repeat protein
MLVSRMAHPHSLARWLAPLALVACAVAVFATVSDTTGTSSSRDTDATREQGATSNTATRTTTTEKRPSSPRTYTVKPGDVLSVIAEKTGVPIERLQALNPGVDARTLRVGEKLRLRR